MERNQKENRGRCIQRNLALSPPFEIARRAQPGFDWPFVDHDLHVDQLVGKVLNAQNGEQPIHDDLIDEFMPNDPVKGVIIGQLVVSQYILSPDTSSYALRKEPAVPDELRTFVQLRYVVFRNSRMMSAIRMHLHE